MNAGTDLGGLAEAIGRVVRELHTMSSETVPLLAGQIKQIGMQARRAVAFDAAARHRNTPPYTDTVSWIERHIGAATPAEISLYQQVRGTRMRPVALLPARVRVSTAARYIEELIARG